MSAPSGSLVVVGTGIKLIRHMTIEALDHIRRADKLLYLVVDLPTRRWLELENPSAESLDSCLVDGQPRLDSYQAMVERILDPVRAGKRVCAAFYGHPGVFVHPSHAAVARARQEGFPAVMLPGVSAEDCLFADVGVDPARHGCQSFEATDFLLCRRRFDPRSLLVLWQVGLIGEHVHRDGGYRRGGLSLLREVLLASYPEDHEVILYEAAQHPEAQPRLHRLPLGRLVEGPVSPLTTLLVPVREEAVADLELAARLAEALSSEPG